MTRLRQHLHRLPWIALLAIFGLVLAPTVSRLLASSSTQAVWAEVCTPQGTRVLATSAGDDDRSSAPAGHHLLDHCPLCGLSGGAPALPPVAWALPQPLQAQHSVPALFLHAPRRLFAWASAQPRAPPAAV